MTRNLVWVTRTDPFSRLTAKRLAGAGHEALCAPVLRVVPLPSPPLMAVPDALVFTSLNGVRLHRFSSALANVPVFAVGDHSARYARARGYRRVTSAAGNIVGLSRTIRHGLTGPAELLHVGAATPAGDLAALLGSSYRVRRLPVYGIEEIDPRELVWIADRIEQIGHILVHSPRAGVCLVRWLALTMPEWPGVVHCISPAAAEAFELLPGISTRIAERPDERSLLAAFVENGNAVASAVQEVRAFDRSRDARRFRTGESAMLDFCRFSAILRKP